MNWTNPTPIGQPLPKDKIYMIKGYKLATLDQIADLLDTGLYITSFNQVSPFTVDKNIDYVSYDYQYPIPITSRSKLYIVNLSNDDSYIIFGNYNSHTNMFQL